MRGVNGYEDFDIENIDEFNSSKLMNGKLITKNKLSLIREIKNKSSVRELLKKGWTRQEQDEVKCWISKQQKTTGNEETTGMS
jgi:hypothetical protein